MQPEDQTDHIALLALMICGTLIEQLDKAGQLDEATTRRLRHLVQAVRTHAEGRDLNDLEVLFDNIDRALGRKIPKK